MHNRKPGWHENTTTTGQIDAITGKETHHDAAHVGSSLLAQVINLAFTGDRETFVRIVSLFVLVVGAVILVGTALPWVVTAVAGGGGSIWAGRRARRSVGTSTRPQS